MYNTVYNDHKLDRFLLRGVHILNKIKHNRNCKCSNK